MIKRKDYLDGKYTHREYYDQFVNNEVVGRVVEHFGIDTLLAIPMNLNDIQLEKWIGWRIYMARGAVGNCNRCLEPI